MRLNVAKKKTTCQKEYPAIVFVSEVRITIKNKKNAKRNNFPIRNTLALNREESAICVEREDIIHQIFVYL